jgi:hypothetical protein
MYVRRDELVPNFPLVHNGGLEFGANFVVKDLEINTGPTVGEGAHDGVVGGQLVFVGLFNTRAQRIVLQRLWKATVMYWLPLQARLGSLPVLSV